VKRKEDEEKKPEEVSEIFHTLPSYFFDVHYTYLFKNKRSILFSQNCSTIIIHE
jgi:hypothetical protein